MKNYKMSFEKYYESLDSEATKIKNIIRKNTIESMEYLKEMKKITIKKSSDKFRDIKNGFIGKECIYIFVANTDFEIDSTTDFNKFPKVTVFRPQTDNSIKISKNDVFYVGQTQDISTRMSVHLVGVNKSKTRGLRLQCK